MAKVTEDCERGEGARRATSESQAGVGEAANNKQHKSLNETGKPEHCSFVQDTSNQTVQKHCRICDIPVFLQASCQNIAEYLLKRTAQYQPSQ